LPNIIAQPQYLAPSNPAKTSTTDEVIVSDEMHAHETAPSPPRQFTPPTAARPPEKKSKFWEILLGPSIADAETQDPFVARKERTASPPASAAPAPAVPAKPAPANQVASGSLWSQLLGKSPPPPNRAAESTEPPAASPMVSQLTPASAEVEDVITFELPPGRRPTLRDIEEARTPATSMTVGRPGMPPRQVAPIARAGQPAQQPVGLPPVPTIPTQSYASAASQLWRPFTMTNDAPAAAMPVEMGDPASAPAAARTAELPESERVPSLLRPFYVTNPPTHSANRGNSSVASDAAPQSVGQALAQSSLGRQLALANTEDLRTPINAAIDAQVKHDQQPWDGRVTVQWPLLANPFTMTNDAPPLQTTSPGVAPVAFMQEQLPEPSLAADGSDEATGTGEKKDERDTLAGASTIGDAPEETSLNFLRAQTVLLEPGKSQFDIGFSYTFTDNDFPILITDGMGTVIGVDEVKIKARELAVPMELRYGLLRRLQGFVQVPVGWANVQAAIDNFDEYSNDGGIGDVGFGLTAQLRDAYKDCPYIIGTLAGLAPTGGDPFGFVGTVTPNAPSLGNGFWSISGNLLWVQPRYDPVVVFYGFGARYQFARRFIGVEFEPGMEYNYTLGTGFAVNERVTLSAQFFGAYIEDLKANGDRLEGTNQEPMNLRLAATLAKPCNRLVEPFVTFGLTDDAIAANFGITWTY
jgi:hypothetical protein